MRFLVFTDLHYDAMPDGQLRLEKLIRYGIDKKAEFILGLGDICHPKEENRFVIDSFDGCGLPYYFIPGNHDKEYCNEARVLKFWNLEKSYFSIMKDNVKFIFLSAVETIMGSTVPEEQVEWLAEELKADSFFVILTHQSLASEFITPNGKSRGMTNRKIIQNLLEERNKLGRHVLFCMNGHDHGSSIAKINGITYYTLNSCSYIWQGAKELFPYSPEVHEKYPFLKNEILYKEPLHCMVNIDEAGSVVIEGMEGSYLTVSPKDAGMDYSYNGVSILPHTLSACLTN